MNTDTLTYIDTDKVFDNLKFGDHFITKICPGHIFIKIRVPSNNYGYGVWYVDECGNKNNFDAVSYDGVPAIFKFDCPVQSVLPNLPIDYSDESLKQILQDFLDSKTPEQLREELEKREGIKKSIDISTPSDIISSSTDNVSVDVLKNKQIEPTKTMQTYNTLKDAVISAISELKSAGTVSAYQITQLIRQKANQGDWEILDCAARPNSQNINFWINHDDVRRNLGDLYANDELTALGFTGRTFNGTYLEYVFDNSNVTQTASVGPATPTASSVVGSGVVPSPTFNTNLRVQAFLKRHIDDVEAPTLKQIQSALKTNGITCQDFSTIVENLGYNVVPETIGHYSTYYVTLK